eukprot:CAMPEP_0167801490 /NCGR_PEP_ID=MMETSP0111_2-20121227/18463_1 /TAXON_ID=91324 /ORGANISM="Lotharella globosa, Strain CCCM811" /LENGTH=36 /DNA_ID= /DNA_START= /DNA_END= /DNA_ORIENTATION=
MMRNALRLNHGGSGKALDKTACTAAVKFWKTYTSVQ